MSEHLDYKLYYRRRLPHYQPAEGLFFMTYRLAFSLPQAVMEQQRQKMLEFEQRSQGLAKREQQELLLTCQKVIFAIEDAFLGKCDQSPHWLLLDAIAKLVLDSLWFNHTKHYELFCVLLMSNHVHIVIKPLLQRPDTPYSLAQIMKEHKTYVAKQANMILNRSGEFWSREYYDYWIRDEEEFRRVINYILQNPVKAGLVKDYRDWKHY